MTRTLNVVPAFIIAGLVACHSHPGEAPTPTSRVLGSYSYVARLGAYDEVGVFGISPDTVILNSEKAICLEDRRAYQSDSHWRAFDCSGSGSVISVRLIIDLVKPTASRWTAVRTVMQPQQECTSDSVTKTGEKICLRYMRSQVAVDQGISGPLFVSPVKLDQASSRD